MVTNGPPIGRSERNFSDAAVKAAEDAEQRGLVPKDEDSYWKVDLTLIVEGHDSPVHIKWYQATLTSTTP